MKFKHLLILLTLLIAACNSTPAAKIPAVASLQRYDMLSDTRSAPLGPKSWIGNLKWFAEETDNRLSLTFRTMPKSSADAEFVALTQIVGSDNKIASFPSARRTLLRMRLPDDVAVSRTTYRPDAVITDTSAGQLSVIMPMNRFGAIITAQPSPSGRPVSLLFDAPWILGSRLVTDQSHAILEQNQRITWTQGNYTVVFHHNGVAQTTGGNISSIRSQGNETLRIAVAFYVNAETARTEADSLFNHAAEAAAESHVDWNAYLNSCPITHFPNGYHTHDSAGNRDLQFTDDELVTRQLWHWQTALANCYDIVFNDMPAQLCPDKSTWFGSWSNDTPEALRALAHTNKKEFVRQALVDYVRVGITPDGDLSWYIHGTGVRGLGNPHDVGRFSHGVPAILSAIADYVDTTGDTSILYAPADDRMNVWQKLRTYMENVFHRRTTSPEGLVAWANLWEGGADDKAGPFFSKADIGAWCNAVENLNNADFKKFYVENSRPVVNLYEQAFFLNALNGMEKLAVRVRDQQAERFANEKFNHLVRVLHDKHWSEQDHFYYDRDLTTDELVHVKNQDAFYLLRFLPADPDRTEKLLAHLHNPDEFGLPYIPTLAKNDPQFKATGYWSGGYWPRESAAIAYSLAAVGHKDEAELLLIKALMSSTGKVILENVNPLTGQPSTPIKSMAYSVVLNVALHDIHNMPFLASTSAPSAIVASASHR